MTGKIKALGLAFVAITAMSAVAASAAQAGTLHIGANPAVLTGHSDPKAGGGFQQHILTIGGSFNSICDTASFEGRVHQVIEGVTPTTQTIQEVIITPTYQSCKLGGTAATTQLNGCKYTLTGTGESANTFKLDIVGCTAGKQIQIKTALCTVDIPELSGLSHVIAKNEADNHITLEAKVSGITALQTGAACPGGNNKHTSSASFTGNSTVTAFKDKEENHFLTKHGHQYPEYTHIVPAVELIST